MKKFLAFIALGGMALLAGCLDKSNDNSSPLDPGWFIYGAAKGQNDAALEPANVAMRLFILLREAQEREMDLSTANNTTLDTLQVTTPDGKAHNLKLMLFGDTNTYGSTITQTSPGVWKVSYPSYSNYYGGFTKYDTYLKEGDIYIDTQGSMLDVPGAVWNISTPAETSLNRFAVIMPTNGYTYEVVNTLSNYTIMTDESNSNVWTISADEVDSFDANTTDNSGNPANIANWSLGFTLTATPADDPSFFNRMYGATYTLYGDGGGASFMASVDYYNFGYHVTSDNPLLYRLSCGTTPAPPKVVSGEEACRLDVLQGTSSFPSNDVKVTFVETAPCTTTRTLSYIGLSQTF